jgi:hypothetical protein
MWHVGWYLVVACHGHVVAGENAARQRTNGAEWHMSDKSAEDTNAQWFADPVRGWIRVEARQQPKKKTPAQPPQNRNEDPKTKASPASFDY